MQGHIVISGAENGLMAVWDLRQGKHPTTILSAHKSPIRYGFRAIQFLILSFMTHDFTSSVRNEVGRIQEKASRKIPIV